MGLLCQSCISQSDLLQSLRLTPKLQKRVQYSIPALATTMCTSHVSRPNKETRAEITNTQQQLKLPTQIRQQRHSQHLHGHLRCHHHLLIPRICHLQSAKALHFARVAHSHSMQATKILPITSGATLEHVHAVPTPQDYCAPLPCEPRADPTQCGFVCTSATSSIAIGMIIMQTWH